MKKILFTILTFFALITIFGQTKNSLLELVNPEIDLKLTEGLKLDLPQQKLNVFDNNTVFKAPFNVQSNINISSDNNFITSAQYPDYYHIDFAEDPFDGKIQILIMGEPLPSPLMTIFVTIGVIAILLYYKKKKQVTV